MDMDIDRHSVPINELSEQLEGCNVHCPEIENNTPKESCKYLKNGKLEFNEPKLRPENHPLLAESKANKKFNDTLAHVDNFYARNYIL
ncbi:unnamed protein product [Rhizopus stolonifer]